MAQPAWMDEDAPQQGGEAAAPAWMDEDAPAGTTPEALRGVNATPFHMPDTMNPMVPQDSWNGVTSFLHGMSLGADIPASARLLAQREADIYRKNGADEEFIQRQLPIWEKEAFDGLTAEHGKFAKTAGGSNLLAELAGSLPTTMAGTSLGMGALAKGLESMGLPWMAKLISGTLARTTPGPVGAAGRVISRATQGLTEGGLAGTEQAGLNPEVPIEKQAKLGGGIGLATSPIMPAIRPVVRAFTGTIPQDLAQAAGRVEALGVPIAKNQLVDRAFPQIFARAFGPPPAGQTAKLAAARATNNADILDQIYGLAPRKPGLNPGADTAALNAVENRLSQVPGGSLRHAMHLAGPIGAGMALGGGAAAGGELLSLLGHLSDPRAWPLILVAAAGAKGARWVGNALMNSSMRKLSQRANALGMTTSEYLGVPNVAIPLANRTEEYSAQ